MIKIYQIFFFFSDQFHFCDKAKIEIFVPTQEVIKKNGPLGESLKVHVSGRMNIYSRTVVNSVNIVILEETQTLYRPNI